MARPEAKTGPFHFSRAVGLYRTWAADQGIEAGVPVTWNSLRAGDSWSLRNSSGVELARVTRESVEFPSAAVEVTA